MCYFLFKKLHNLSYTHAGYFKSIFTEVKDLNTSSTTANVSKFSQILALSTILRYFV